MLQMVQGLLVLGETVHADPTIGIFVKMKNEDKLYIDRSSALYTLWPIFRKNFQEAD